MKREIFIKLGASAFLGAAAVTAPALAQDSTSLTPGFPGDTVDPHDTTEQVNDYIVDVAAVTSTSGRTYGVAPIAKTSMDHAPTSFFYGAGMGAHSISNTSLFGVPFARASYDSWSAAGFGVNGDPAINTPGTAVNTAAMAGNQFGFVFTEFSVEDPTTAFMAFNQVVGGTINYDPSTPSRLYVSRVSLATNSNDWLCNVSQFGVGGVTNDGIALIRADGYQAPDCPPLFALTGNNYFRVTSLSRNPAVVNLIHSLGANDPGASIQPLAFSGTTHSPAVMISSDITGGAPIFMGSNFNGEYVYGSTTAIGTVGHVGGASTRGTVSNSHHNFPAFLPGSALGTGTQLMKAGGTTDTIAAFGVAANGAPSGSLLFTLPTVIVDPADGFSSDTGGAAGGLQFGQYFSATPFRGGSGPAAIGKDQQGRMIVAAQVHSPTYVASTQTDNLIAVARYDGTTMEWSMAAHAMGNSGKDVYGTFGSAVIGTLVGTDAAGTAGGPSLASPMIDSVGNIYFNGRVELTGAGFFRNALLRAVYDEATFSYKLELVVMEGDVATGGNTGLNYQIRYLAVAGANGSSPSATWSSSMNQEAYNTNNAATIVPSSTDSLGGIVISANIIYDVDGNGLYEELDSATNPTAVDQDYNVLLYITAAEDCNENGIPDDLDISDGTSADGDGNGVPDDCGAGTQYCFGDGSGTPCPCANGAGPGEGCGNSTGAGGVLLSSGSNSIVADDLLFTASQLIPSQPGLLFGAINQINGGNGITFGDGLRCAGGGIQRMGVRVPNGTGTATWGPGLAGIGQYGVGDTRNFQVWYRDPVNTPCGFSFNLTNGVSVTFAP